MNKNLLNLILLFSLTVSILPFLVLAQDRPLDCCILGKTVVIEGNTYNKGETVGRGDICSLTNLATDHITKKWTLICLLSSVKLITDWVFTFLVIFVSAMVIIGAYEISTAAGSPEKVKKGKDYILYALVGFVVALLSKGIPDLISVLLGI